MDPSPIGGGFSRKRRLSLWLPTTAQAEPELSAARSSYSCRSVNYTTGAAIHAGTHRQGVEQPVRAWVPSIGISGTVIYTSALADLRAFPADARRDAGFELRRVQQALDEHDGDRRRDRVFHHDQSPCRQLSRGPRGEARSDPGATA